MTNLTDAPARHRVLTDFDSTLLVEAAAGTGKTALLAGRLTMLLAKGAEPDTIAAITFTELSASALGTRVREYIECLLSGDVPRPLRIALPQGLGDDERIALSLALDKLDGLTTSTIHAFCQKIITSYAVEAGIDPGAQMLDALQADAAFDSVFEKWLRRRLQISVDPGDPIATLSKDDPRHIVEVLRKLAQFRSRHRGARAVPAKLDGRPDNALSNTVADFREWISLQPSEVKTSELLKDLETLVDFFAGTFDSRPDFPVLWRIAHPPRLQCMRRGTFDLLPPKRKSAWERIAGKERGALLNQEAEEHFQRVNRSYRDLMGRIATALVDQLSTQLDEVLQDYADFKRAAAVLDFDDLLEKARELVSDHEQVRRALGERYRYILIDEFQDTDPIQTEIFFRIAAMNRSERWQDGDLRAGALFMVGDPKQAIYRFRGADIGSYAQARASIERLWPHNIVQVTANFRSRPKILAHINKCFEHPLSGNGQPGYVFLEPTLEDPKHTLPCVAKMRVSVPPDSKAADVRDSEAEAVADLCSRLIGNLRIRNENGTITSLAPGDIALLAPTGTDLWRYERALDQRGILIASQAGKSLFRHQEVQDLIALARVLADSRDTLAFGALMRGPLVGLTEEELLDITASLPPRPNQPEAFAHFSVLTDLENVGNTVARRALGILQDLRRRTRSTTPALLLGEAVERFAIGPILALRKGDRSTRALANVEIFLERARPYGVRGLKAFVRDLTRVWRVGLPQSEGRVDAEGDAIEIITIHTAKGLEWPVVIPINTGTLLRAHDEFVYRTDDETMHWMIGDVVPPDLFAALETEEQSLARERKRLWYVACTRAREVLIIPEIVGAQQQSWARIVDLAHPDLPQLDVSHLAPTPSSPEVELPNLQTYEVFESERAAINAVSIPTEWVRPSDYDADRMQSDESTAFSGIEETLDSTVPIGAGRVRGLLLHKLIEESLTGELIANHPSFVARARVLMGELGVDLDGTTQLPNPDEIAATALGTLELPDIAALRSRLIPEWPVYASRSDRSKPTAIAGRIDAVLLDAGRPAVVVDWKSDAAPTGEDMQYHARQLRDYIEMTGAARGILVYMSLGTVRWIDR